MESQTNVEQTTTTNTNDVKTDVAPQLSLEQQLSNVLEQIKSNAIAIGMMYADGKPQTEIDEFGDKQTALIVTRKQIENDIVQRDARLKHENELNDYLSIIADYNAKRDEYNRLNSTLSDESKQTDETFKTALNAFNEIHAKLIDELTQKFNNVKRVIHVAPGTTGDQLKKQMSGTTTSNDKSKNAMLKQLMSEGKTNDDLLKLGYVDGTIRYARWEYNKTLKQNGK